MSLTAGSLTVLYGVTEVTSSGIATGSVDYPGWARVTALSDTLVTLSGSYLGSATFPMAKGQVFDALYKAQGTVTQAAGFVGQNGLITSIQIHNENGGILAQKMAYNNGAE
jgi:hypothetical protein